MAWVWESARGRARWVAVALVSASVVAPTGAAMAQQTTAADAPAKAALSIPAGPLEQGLIALGRQTSLKLVYQTEVAQGRRTKGVTNATGPIDALARLLEGTGLVYVFTGAGTVTIEDILRVQATDAIALDDISVQGQGQGEAGESPTGKGKGFVASRSLTATKTDTPLIETPQSISVVTSNQLETQGIESVNSALRYTAGVLGERNGASDTRFGGFIIRGFEATGRSFYKDGLRLPGTQFTEFQGLDPYGAERIEILKGPASVLYGQNGPGGIVNYVTKRPTDYAFGEVSASVGSFDRYQGQFDFGGPINGSDELSYRFTGLAREGDVQIDTVDDNRIFLAPSVTWKPSDDTTLTVLASYQRDRAGWGLQFLPADGTVFKRNGRRIPVDRFVGEPDFDRYDTDMAMAGYLLEHKFSDAVTFRQNVRYAYLKNEQDEVGGAGYVNPADESNPLYNRFVSIGRSELNTFAIDNSAQIKFETGLLKHTAVVGLDYRYSDFTDKSRDGEIDPIDIFDPRYGEDIRNVTLGQDDTTKQSQTGLYAQDQIKIDRLSIVFGGRYDWVDTKATAPADLPAGAPLPVPGDDRAYDSVKQKDAAFTGKAGLIYNFDNGLAPYVSYSESFLPSVNNPNGDRFDPETGVQYEAGVKFQPQGWNTTLTAAVFDLTRKNYQRSFGVPGDVRVADARSRGLELEAVASLAEGFNVRAAYTYVDVEILKDQVFPDRKGNMTYGIPKHYGALWADYTVQDGNFKGLGFGGGVRAQSSTFGDDGNTFKVAGFTLADATVSYKRDNYKLALNVSNVFDKRYVSSCFSRGSGCFYGEGRKAVLKASYTW